MEKIFLASIALEKNKWAEGKIPSYKVSDFIHRVKNDGFYGIELWENHYMLADREEQKKLENADVKYIFNSYLSLKDGLTDDLRKIADAICRLGAAAVKYNFSLKNANTESEYDKDDFTNQIDTLLKFAELLPNNVKLLCECHANTIMEEPEIAGRVFEGLDERFGAIIHLSAEKSLMENCFKYYGNRILHIHTAYTGEMNEFEPLKNGDKKLRSNMEYFKTHGFSGSCSVEFVKEEDSAENYYKNALKDLEYLKNL